MFCLMFIVMMNGLNFVGNLGGRLAPGEWYWLRQPFYKCQSFACDGHQPVLTPIFAVGIILHLATILREFTQLCQCPALIANGITPQLAAFLRCFNSFQPSAT